MVASYMIKENVHVCIQKCNDHCEYYYHTSFFKEKYINAATMLCKAEKLEEWLRR